ncbi:hypothetical protein DAEQUDRAFT_717165 [Daedalea quercina L-15889]|uniref:Uncharacterized protein n=1 Tax=Daedalea quercina L-15889 TaxID=1314783 RepID=A0A165LZH6_9APHY|nr:hypothetical protein DAEQUDRAFT_717165 [Daedalea quercina L-15889]
MRWSQSLVVPLYALSVVSGVCAYDQVPMLRHPGPQHASLSARPWDERPSEDATGNLIFQALASLLQLGPNSKYKNGHSIVRASIPAGTLLYHGRPVKDLPTRDWIAFDPEHSHVFAAGPNGTLFTFMTTRPLQLLFFDGCSGNKFDGVVDTQDALFWGKVGYDPHDGYLGELARFEKMCDWAKQYGIDGIARMQIDFEMMYCNISNGALEVVSAVPLVATDGVIPPMPHKPAGESESAQPSPFSAKMVPPPKEPFPITRQPMVPPEGWRGSLPTTWTEVKHTGAWHNEGEVRIRVDPSTMVSFYDPALTSLFEGRRLNKRVDYRLTNISEEDIARVQEDVAEMVTRDPVSRSGVDWQGLARVIQDRFSDRLPFVRHLLHKDYSNASEQAVAVRRELLVSLLPYMGRDRVGTPEWYAQMADACASRYTAHLPMSQFTKQEHVLYNATKEVLHEICRVYTETWRDAFDVEEQNVKVAEQRLVKWREEFDALIEWLDWPVWMRCNPACGVDEFCTWPQGAFWESDRGLEPRCAPLGVIYI